LSSGAAQAVSPAVVSAAPLVAELAVTSQATDALSIASGAVVPAALAAEQRAVPASAVRPVSVEAAVYFYRPAVANKQVLRFPGSTTKAPRLKI
jgi:hypothetical protein